MGVSTLECQICTQTAIFPPPLFCSLIQTIPSAQSSLRNCSAALLTIGYWRPPMESRGWRSTVFFSGSIVSSLHLKLPDCSGFRVLVDLIPIARRPNIAVLLLTKNAQRGLHEIAIQRWGVCLLCQTVHVGRRFGSSHSACHGVCRTVAEGRSARALLISPSFALQNSLCVPQTFIRVSGANAPFSSRLESAVQMRKRNATFHALHMQLGFLLAHSYSFE